VAAYAGLVAFDPANMTWLDSLSIANNHLARALRRAGDLTGALASQRSALAQAARLAEIDASNSMRTSYAAWALLNVGDLEVSLAGLDGARRSYRSARAVFETLVFARAFPRRVLGWLGSADEGLGQVELAAGRNERARAAFERGIAFLSGEWPREPVDM